MTTPLSDPGLPDAPTGLISANPPIDGEPAVSPPAGRALLPGLLINSLVLYGTYGGLIAILLPTQVALLDEANKVANLAIVTTVDVYKRQSLGRAPGISRWADTTSRRTIARRAR